MVHGVMPNPGLLENRVVPTASEILLYVPTVFILVAEGRDDGR
jgi:hypothetical protein